MAPSSAPLRPLRLTALAVAALLLCCAGCTSADSPPATLIAVAARDVEGGIVSEGDALYLPNVTACRDACTATPGCNLWVYCAAADGCMGSPVDCQRDLSTYRQCWLKYDKPTNWRVCQGVQRIRRVLQGGSTCHQYPGNQPPGEDYCPNLQQCAAILDTELDGQVLNDGDNTYVNSPEECCGRCTQTECWLKNANPTSPQPKGGNSNTPSSPQRYMARAAARPLPPLPLAVAAAALLLSIGLCSAAPPPASLIAVAARDVEGGLVTDPEPMTLPSAAACRDNCTATPGCNLWVYCAAADGCMGSPGDSSKDISRYRQCWLKFDKPTNKSGWPRSRTARDQATGWLSGTTAQGVKDVAPREMGYSRCTCRAEYANNGHWFKGVCAPTYQRGAFCFTDTDCQYPPSDGHENCPTTQQCTAILDTDLEGEVLGGGASSYANSPEECCGLCAQQDRCNAWTWCSDPNGCSGGDLTRFRQCWLKNADPTSPQPKGGYGNSTGWISGVRMAWIPQ
ncbi:hypothetical protein HYH03_002756 [Edaphochlamys debaryana]|uniref:Apple domain-containing protein n=1 Tax=Edaphochlamys debaryana TaxID=47281 RepID=A0A835YID3_9CHLO|nr:hypothetical protein HYH03_002756 [Edaphochlamys debaryana]|eukprot:KAG2499175.1 hypothetical protein HYH03_002756 [Edaphochlamys debaryana]